MKKSTETKVMATVLSLVLMFFTGTTVFADNEHPVIYLRKSMISSIENYKNTEFLKWREEDSKLCARHIEATEEEIYETARVLEHECCGFGDEGRYLVATVIANRVVSDIWPDTVNDVVMQKGQFGDGKGKDPCDDCIAAAEAVLNEDIRALPAYVMNFQSVKKDYWASLDCYAIISQGKYVEYFCFDTSYRDSLINSFI